MRWVGLDLHKRYVTACALDDAGELVAEHRRLPPDVDVLTQGLAGLGDAVTVAMEATLQWAWLHDQLSAAGIAAVATHPYQVKLMWHARCKTDPIDARKLADLLRTNLSPTIWVPDTEVRAWLATVAVSPMGRLQIDLLLEMVDALTERIGWLDHRMKRLVQHESIYKADRVGQETG